MRLKLKLIMLALGAGSIAMQFGFGSCGRFWGDVVGDLIFLQGVD